MIGHLRGRLLRLRPDRVLLDIGGVGYEAHIPVSTFYELQRVVESHGEDAEVALHIHTHVREDAFLLYGFRSERERELFELLISVSGIGPRLAQAALSGLTPDDLVAAIQTGDARRLSSVPGIGKKTAERLLIDLRDKVSKLSEEPATEAAAPPPADDDLVQALVNLGYKASAAERAVSDVAKANPEAPFADQLRLALKKLSRV